MIGQIFHYIASVAAPDFTPPVPGEPVFPLNIEDPFKNNERFVAEFFNMLATLALIIVLLFVIAWVFRRMMNVRIAQTNASSTIKIIEQRALSPKTLLYLIEVEGRVVLVAESQNGVSRLTEYFQDSDESPLGHPVRSKFSELIEKQGQK